MRASRKASMTLPPELVAPFSPAPVCEFLCSPLFFSMQKRSTSHPFPVGVALPKARPVDSGAKRLLKVAQKDVIRNGCLIVFRVSPCAILRSGEEKAADGRIDSRRTLMIAATCPTCQTVCRAEDDLAGQLCRCLKCGGGVRVPGVAKPRQQSLTDQIAWGVFFGGLGVVGVCFLAWLVLMVFLWFLAGFSDV